MKRYSLSFVFPMFNESDNIGRTIHRASELASELTDDYEIIVVDDASTDGSAEALKDIAMKNPRVKGICLQVNSKMGGALKKGLKSATKEVIIYTDCDFPAREEDIRKAIKLLESADIVTGSSLGVKDVNIKRIIISKVYNMLVQFLFNLSIKDINAGLKIYRKTIFEGMNLNSSSPFICVEIFAEAARKGYKIREYGIIFERRTRGNSSISRMDVLMKSFSDMITYRFLR
jgi:glycosyltransferase involved in cell wall biosynthesis